MKKVFLFSLLIFNVEAYQLNLNSDKWYLVGTLSDIDLNHIGLIKGDTIWNYKDRKWNFFVKDKNFTSNKYSKIDSLKAGDGFWLYSKNDKSINLDEGSFEEKLHNGWNLVAVNNNITVDNYVKNKDIRYIWSYRNSSWFYYNKSYNNSNLTSLNKGEAIWVYLNSIVKFGNEDFDLENGIFDIDKTSDDSIEDIWNIGFNIENGDVNDFSIGILIVKTSSQTRGEIVIGGLNIKDGVLSKPKYVIVKGEKSNGDSIETLYDKDYNPNDILSKVVELDNSIFKVKFGTLILNQDDISQSSFKSKATYHIKLNSDKLKIRNAKSISLGNITNYNLGDKFNNKNGIEGDLKIK